MLRCRLLIAKSYNYDDGTHTVFLSTKGSNVDEVPSELINFLNFVAADINHCEDNFNDNFVSSIQKSVRDVKADREMGSRYMTVQELMDEQFKEGITEGVLLGIELLGILTDKGTVSKEQREVLSSLPTDMLPEYIELAREVATVDEFMERFNSF